MPAVKSLQRSSDKWVRQSAVSGPEYQAGIESPRKDWATETGRAEAAYQDGVQKGIQRKAFGKGVAKAGTDKWKQGALTKGVARWSAGIAQSEDAYQKGFEPYRETIERTTLPARGAKGDPKNIARVQVMAKALHDKKLSMQGN